MTYFPMFISIEGKPCLVIGGGKVASRKCRGLLAFGAEVTAVAEQFQEEFGLHKIKEADKSKNGSENERGGGNGRLTKYVRSFRDSDITEKPWALVIAATDVRKVNARAARLCHARGIPVNVADSKSESTFFFPAYCIEGAVAAGITTSGHCPKTASALRQRLEQALPGWLKEAGTEAVGGRKEEPETEAEEEGNA